MPKPSLKRTRKHTTKLRKKKRLPKLNLNFFDDFFCNSFAFSHRLYKRLLHVGNGRAGKAEQMEHHLGITRAGSTAQRVGSVFEDHTKKVPFALIKIRLFFHEPNGNVLHVRVLKNFINLRLIILVKIAGLTVAPTISSRT